LVELERPADEGVARRGDGGGIGFCQWGDLGGAAVFFLHGTPGSRLFRTSAATYREQGLRVVTYDRPGYGLSTLRTDQVVADSVADLVAVANTLGLTQFGVAGISGGGPHALAAAAALPQRVSRCATIVTAAPYTAEDLDFFDGMDNQEHSDWLRRLQGRDAITDQYRWWIDYLATGMPDLPVDATLKAHFIQSLHEAFLRGPDGFIEDVLLTTRDWGFAVSDIRTPTTLMFAREDGSVPPGHVNWFTAQMPHAQVIWVDGGHIGHRDAEETQLMRWVGHGAA